MTRLIWMGAATLAAVATPAGAQELSEETVKWFVNLAWQQMPEQFSERDGSVLIINKATERESILVPLETAREVIIAGRRSAHAQTCNLPEDQKRNFDSLKARENAKKKWSKKQEKFMAMLHLSVVQIMTGRVKMVAREGDGAKDVVILDEQKAPARTCTEEQRQKVRDMIADYVKTGPPLVAEDVPKSGTLPGPAAAAAAPVAETTKK